MWTFNKHNLQLRENQIRCDFFKKTQEKITRFLTIVIIIIVTINKVFLEFDK